MTSETGRDGAEGLPDVLPIFPLSGVLLLPRGQLPLNIFEPRYLAMTREAMTGDQLIGMIQPRAPGGEREPSPVVYDTGCAGRITAFRETDDGRYLITLSGVCRFIVTDEIALTDTGYRRVSPTYARYLGDLVEPDAATVDRDRLLRALQFCVPAGSDNEIDWSAVERMPSDRLVTSLAMLLPFSPGEKQALLEAADIGACAEILVTLMEMLAASDVDADTEGMLQ